MLQRFSGPSHYKYVLLLLLLLLPGARLGKDKVSSFGFASVNNAFISYFGHQFICTCNMQWYGRATCDILYVVLSAGQRACKDRAMPRLMSISNSA